MTYLIILVIGVVYWFLNYKFNNNYVLKTALFLTWIHILIFFSNQILFISENVFLKYILFPTYYLYYNIFTGWNQVIDGNPYFKFLLIILPFLLTFIFGLFIGWLIKIFKSRNKN